MTVYQFHDFRPVLPKSSEFWIASEVGAADSVRTEPDVGNRFGAVMRAENGLVARASGKVISELDDATIGNLIRSAEEYQARWCRSAKDLEADS